MSTILNRLKDAAAKANESLELFEGTFVPGIKEMATIEEGAYLQQLFLQEIPKFRNVPVPIAGVGLLAQTVQAGNVTYIPVEKMIAAGFPKDKPIKLFIEVEQGRKQTGDEGMDPAVNVEQTVGQIMFNVYKVLTENVIPKSGTAIQLKGGSSDSYGLKSVSEEIDRAYNVGAAVPQPPAQPAAEGPSKKK